MNTVMIENRMKELFREVFNRANLEVIDRYFAEDCKGFEFNYGEIGDREHLKEYLSWLQDIFPDSEAQIKSLIIENDRAIARFCFRGIHLFEFLGIKPADRVVSFDGNLIVLFKEDTLIKNLLLGWDREGLQNEYRKGFV